MFVHCKKKTVIRNENKSGTFLRIGNAPKFLDAATLKLFDSVCFLIYRVPRT